MPHAHGAEFMDGPTFSEDPAADMHDLESCRLEHLLRGFLHVLGHAVLVVSKLVVKTQRRDSPLVFHHRIEFNVIFVARKHLAESAHSYERSLVLANLFFEGGPKSMRVSSPGKHGAAASAFKPVAADELGVLFGQVAESG